MMRLRVSRPGLGCVRPESDQATCQLLEDSEQMAADGRSHEQPSWQAALQVGKGIGAVDLVGDRQGRALGGLPHCQGMPVIGQHLGPEVLLCRQPRQAGGILQRQPVLEPFEGILNAPSAMVQIGKVLSGIRGRIHQRHHHRMDSAIRRHHAHGCRGAGAFVVGTIGRIGRAEGYHGLRLTGAQEVAHRDEARVIDPHAEGNPSLAQMQPGLSDFLCVRREETFPQ